MAYSILFIVGIFIIAVIGGIYFYSHAISSKKDDNHEEGEEQIEKKADEER